MGNISAIENTVTTTIRKLHSSSTNNLVCGQANCYSNCDIDYEYNIPLDLDGCNQGLCGECNHDLRDHHRCRATWRSETNVQVLFGDDFKRQWRSAIGKTGKRKVLATLRAKVLGDLTEANNHATSELAQLAQLVERYDRLSLSGSFLTQVDNTIKLLDQKHALLIGKREVSQDQLREVEKGLYHIKKKRELFNTAQEAPKAKGITRNIILKVKGFLGFKSQ